ncbi:hypothetical protein I203_105793 [Kwoniella mangroviensis CBS 8507]|uniref:uncharacterized protein n=1 Tax=Kwoniella mangroviensis CBS 8507 TaxID=1296122 RepID=UPI00080CE8CC|nr:uncharacterized protein I203_01605 [Kwoniella mangroviensis CBS 8507]OCF69741.1 hypothetical protein I203_01605 [Kwoniella mangroviensis CBS 8507]
MNLRNGINRELADPSPPVPASSYGFIGYARSFPPGVAPTRYCDTPIEVERPPLRIGSLYNQNREKVGYLSFLNDSEQRIPYISNPNFTKSIRKRTIRPNADLSVNSDYRRRNPELTLPKGTVDNVSSRFLTLPGFTFNGDYTFQSAFLQYPDDGGKNKRERVHMSLDHAAIWKVGDQLVENNSERELKELCEKIIKDDEISEFGGISLILHPPSIPPSQWPTRNQNMLEEQDSIGNDVPRSRSTGIQFHGELSMDDPLRYAVEIKITSGSGIEDRNFKITLNSEKTFLIHGAREDGEAWRDLHKLFNHPNGLDVRVRSTVTLRPSMAYHSVDHQEWDDVEVFTMSRSVLDEEVSRQVERIPGSLTSVSGSNVRRDDELHSNGYVSPVTAVTAGGGANADTTDSHQPTTGSSVSANNKGKDPVRSSTGSSSSKSQKPGNCWIRHRKQ